MGVEDQELGPPDSSVEVQDAAAPAVTPIADNDAGSSSAQPGDERKSSLQIVRDAIAATRKEDPAPAASPAAEDEGEREADEAAPPEAPKDGKDDYSDVPFHKHPRFKQLVSERNALKQDAERYQNVQRFLDSSGVSGEEAGQALQIMALSKLDPAKAWEMLKPLAQDLLARTGALLPEDLRDRVSRGELTKEAAAEISRLRAQTAARDSRSQIEAQQRQREEADKASRACVDAAEAWERRVMRDPDYAALSDDLQREVLWLQRQDGVPKDAEGVKKQLDTALKNVKSRRPPERRTEPKVHIGGGAVAGGTQRPANPTTLDIVRNRGRS